MERVAILGGGAAGLTAAFELTAPELDGRYEVTVHQLGWRLGGKGASGRNADRAHRIEEHGLHIWFGFYDNAFDLIQRCYAELDRPADAPLATWEAAFAPCHDVVLLDDGDGPWRTKRWRFPPNDGVPGHSPDQPFEAVMERVVAWLRQALPGEEAGDLPDPFDEALRLLVKLFSVVAKAPGPTEKILGKGLETLRDMLWDASDGEAALPAPMRDYALAFDVMATTVRGILADDLLERGLGAVNDEELMEWLERHGLRRETAEHAPLLRSFYQLCFAYQDGDREQPRLAAGKAVQALLRLAFTYQGAVMYKMHAGMGDTIFAPLYEVLRERGVRFEFFSAVQGLGLAPDADVVQSVDVVRQVAMTGDEYAPLIDVGGLPCWPSRPLWDQLAGGDALRAQGVDFENVANPLGADAVTLERGTDFDHVVLAIPVGALAPLCGELVARNQRFADMLRAAATVPTQALQVWLRASGRDLGWPHEGETVTGGYVAPLDTYCDMTHLIGAEGWRNGEVAHVAYFCGVMSDGAQETAAQATARARDDGARHLREHAAALWPAFDFDRLADPDEGEGEARLAAQYWRANVSPTDRYVLTPPGTVHLRLRPDESGFENLVLAGDWTRNGICGGSVEAAVTSGRMAARAISGHPATIPGLDGWLEAD